jgi:phage shock protein C
VTARIRKGYTYDNLYPNPISLAAGCGALHLRHHRHQRGTRGDSDSEYERMSRYKSPINPVSSKGKTMNKLTLNRVNKKILGVCSGLSDWSGIDVTVIRIAFVLATIFGFGSALLIYIALGLVLD